MPAFIGPATQNGGCVAHDTDTIRDATETVQLHSKSQFRHVVLSMRPIRTSAIRGPEGERLTQLSAEIDKRQLLNAFGKTSHRPVEDLSSEALLAEFIGHLTAAMKRLSDEPERLRALLDKMARWQSA